MVDGGPGREQVEQLGRHLGTVCRLALHRVWHGLPNEHKAVRLGHPGNDRRTTDARPTTAWAGSGRMADNGVAGGSKGVEGRTSCRRRKRRPAARSSLLDRGSPRAAPARRQGAGSRAPTWPAPARPGHGAAPGLLRPAPAPYTPKHGVCQRPIVAYATRVPAAYRPAC